MISNDAGCFIRIPVLSGLVLTFLLSGCFGLIGINNKHHIIGLDTISQKYCNDIISRTQEPDWNSAHVVKEGIKNNLYESGLITLWQNKPYIINITNKDRVPRSFRAPEFLRDAALSKVIYNNESYKDPCLNAVTLAPKSTAKLYLIPLKKGNYEYHETVFWAWLLGETLTGADVGLIQVH